MSSPRDIPPAQPLTSRPVGRRTVLATGTVGAVGVAAVSSPLATAAPAVAASGAAGDGAVFAHGVASGDPLPEGVVLWTRVTPTAASTPGSGAGPKVTVRWEVARDAGFRDVVRRGRFETGPSRDHTVKVDVRGLRPATAYHYRFHLGDATSRVGRTRTAPAHDATPDHLRFGVVSCANLQAGWFSAYRGLAARDDLDAVVHLGDYLYEYGPGEYGYGQSDEDIRKHEPAHEMLSLADYRQRHAQYKRDRDLQDAHAKFAWIVTWDDHEVADNQWKNGAVNHDAGEGDYKARRARAHRAYDEWMPARLDGTAALRDGDRLYRRLRFGTLAELSLLDLRTHRDQQVETTPTPVPNPDPAVNDPDRTITGNRQMQWLKDSLAGDRPQWKIIGNPVMIAPVNFGALPDPMVDAVHQVTGEPAASDGAPYNTDQWDGYTTDRREVFDHIRTHQVKDALFITGDIHSGWAAELPYDASTYPVGDSAGVEFVCTSVTANNLKDITGTPAHTTSDGVAETIKANNRHVKYLNWDDHGFSVLDVTAQRAQMDWYVIGDRKDRNAPITWSVSWKTNTGTGRVSEVSKPVS
ncbi:alkaline phosphatase D [Nocardioides ginsengisegetis]|uniref:Alkaline phosphatase D n=1 Tax=Nocardioides ginsengisegetis TaxID=661491 RepID=A0A7W3PAP0_9ACTN|nr:alkaline phosphatase D [Nocardioides ginsengisegetis]